ncbi:hypothetical protein DENSPDRAFT_929708 [Dentipellis sp. KUC8613]|nr:hypothetical protein DENSPDRAFT_929708 [Dentipellis sp. KUC8613]
MSLEEQKKHLENLLEIRKQQLELRDKEMKELTRYIQLLEGRDPELAVPAQKETQGNIGHLEDVIVLSDSDESDAEPAHEQHSDAPRRCPPRTARPRRQVYVEIPVTKRDRVSAKTRPGLTRHGARNEQVSCVEPPSSNMAACTALYQKLLDDARVYSMNLEALVPTDILSITISECSMLLHCNRGSHYTEKPKFCKNFLFLYEKSQALAPKLPGGAGLFLSIQPKDFAWPAEERLFFTSVARGPKQYLGQYKLMDLPNPRLSRENWLALPDAAQDLWVRRIASSKIPSVQRMRTRVVLRDWWQAEPSESEVNRAFQDKNREEPMQQVIRRALDNGKENLYVWGMQCVGYDIPFMELIRDKMEIDDALRAQIRDSSADLENANAPSSSGTSHKRKHSKHSLDGDSEDDSDYVPAHY